LERPLTQNRVLFLPANQSADFPSGLSVLEACHQLGIVLSAPCGGAGICGNCAIVVKSGDYPPTPADLEYLTADEIGRGTRLACQAKITGDSVLLIPEPKKEEITGILTFGEKRAVEVCPSVKKLSVKVEKPELDGNPFDSEDLLFAAGLSADNLHVPLSMLRHLPDRLRQSDYQGTLVISDEKLIDFEVGDTRELCFGLAVDIGTTTVVGKLVDLTSGRIVAICPRLNSQRSYGDDVISRISYANDKENGLSFLQQAIVNMLNEIIDDLLRQAGAKAEHVYEMVVVGNSVMEHLFLGVNPRYLAEMPYVPVFRGPHILTAQELGLHLHADGHVYVFPLIGRYVGGDTVGVLLTLAAKLQQIWLAVDIGTNGEILLCNRGQIISCSTAAGPAFEGAHIAQGMRATAGAIDRVKADSGEIKCHVIGDAPAIGICGSGLIDAIGTLLLMGVIDETGRIKLDDELPVDLASITRERIVGQGRERRVILKKEDDGSEVSLMQRDIREAQLAKGAIATGIEILLQEAKIGPENLEAIYLAGAFGHYIRKDMALAIGLIPKVLEEKIHFIGNAACTGAELALVSTRERELAETLAMTARYVEISANPSFQDIFANKMFFELG